MAVDISIVVPTYQRTDLLQRCLFALTRQPFEADRYEIIIVSDGPDHRLQEMIVSFLNGNERLPAITIHYLSRKKGPAAARNAGWRMAKGKLILFTDDDCLPAVDWIDYFWRAYQLQPRSADDTRLAFTGKCIVPCSADPTDYEKNISRLATAEFITANCACTRATLEWVGGFDETFPLAWREDSELQFRLLENKVPVIPVPEAVVFHPVRKASWGISLKEQKKSCYNALLYKKHPQLYKERISRTPVWNYYIMIVLFATALISGIANKPWLSTAAFSGWLLLVCLFALKRLRDTRHSLSHITEMLFTSALIPFLSVYWTLYGSWKYKVLFF